MANHHLFVPFIPFSGVSKSQEDDPQPESTGVAKAQSPGVGEVCSASEYFSCVSSPHQLIHHSKGEGSLGVTCLGHGASWVKLFGCGSQGAVPKADRFKDKAERKSREVGEGHSSVKEPR